jgi:hypothetical protein
MPAEHRLGLNQDKRTTPPGPEEGKKYPQEPIGGSKWNAPSRELALKDEKLVAKSDHLGMERSSAPEERPKRAEKG